MAQLRASDTSSRYGLPEPWEQSPGHLGASSVLSRARVVMMDGSGLKKVLKGASLASTFNLVFPLPPR